MRELAATSCTVFDTRPPRNAIEAHAVGDARASPALWAYLANRGVWDALIGPTCSVAATDDDVDRYLDAYAGFVHELGS